MTSTRGPIVRRSVAPGPRPGSLADRLTVRPLVLVVEDEPDIAAFLGAFFRASGLDLRHVNPRGAAEAAGAVQAEAPACVLLDLNLAGFSGLEVLRAVRAFGPGALARTVPVIVLTADANPVTEKAARAAGATDFVTKPFSVRDLFEKVEALATRAP